MSASEPSSETSRFLWIWFKRRGIPLEMSFSAIIFSKPREFDIFKRASHLKVDEIRGEISTKKKNKRIKILRIIER